MPSPAEIIRTKRDGGALAGADIAAFVQGLVDGSWSDAQAAALAMAIVWRGMSAGETTALTRAMTHSGRVLSWAGAGFGKPAIDKHSTGGVGDKLSLMLAPMLAACGAVVPMISGRGLGHTGGTLDKLEALPGYRVAVEPAEFERVLREAGCAIVGAGPQLAPADRRLYALRDVTATVESVPLITASILSKKLAAGLDALVLDVKCGRGAFAPTPAAARALAESLVRVGTAAGLPTRALITDQDAVLGHTAGNALELREALDFLTGPVSGRDGGGAHDTEPVQRTVTLALGAELLVLAGLAPDAGVATERLQHSLASGAAAEHFARMVRALGGPPDVLADAQLPVAPVQRPVRAPRAGIVAAMDTRALGLAVVALGGGRLKPGDAVDPRVGLAAVRPRGAAVAAGEPLAVVHAAHEAAADEAVRALQAAFTLADAAPARLPAVQAVIG
ncbi:MAG: thymidine phosphorylase [Ideonella sp. WA131b]|jgi:thymidine phosphorylase|nr:thymidine phosphorylase [Ideonella sp. WA131b]